MTRAARTLEQTCAGKITVVLNQHQNAPKNFQCVYDAFDNRGALGGIHAALQCCKSDWAIILAVDLPFVMSDAILNLQKIALASSGNSAIVPKQSDGRLQPLCAAYLTAHCLPKIEEFLRLQTSNAVRDFLKTVSTRLVEKRMIAANENLFFNVNSPSDFRGL